jgi:hypothetical protein
MEYFEYVIINSVLEFEAYFDVVWTILNLSKFGIEFYLSSQSLSVRPVFIGGSSQFANIILNNQVFWK